MAEIYIVSTPIGNRQDITLRALEIFTKLDYLLCEDTRKTKQLLDFYQIKPLPILVSFYEPVEEQKIPEVIVWLKAGKSVGLVTNAGTPLISDPGFKLVRECVKENIQVVPIPGASALLAALVVSGLPTDKFTFLGFLPKKVGKKEKLLKEAKYTVIAYESPYRIIKTLELLQKLMPEKQVVICRELTKKFEEVVRGRPEELLEKMRDRKIKGEIVLMF
ncbi:16S rRNA (cytidine(1402)-2'-O)-methyltransferase [Candidatus Beckwithbacteria bacterium CG2_30_44_31]|uniref:Ribosomal RNA small subunit methyltransferase I n=1 Tax=Candidatus Beckwithbacteria bacterium CG2_30_44_31 TaxID=1805035 RepID=A0A1J5AYV2_9BACT|nr:MAG: 16S rRNA (cytidine(1402)-2'-O)-methyltransferase [Candidatus Beckwithbacteria bacterium CG2_30_44_31]